MYAANNELPSEDAVKEQEKHSLLNNNRILFAMSTKNAFFTAILKKLEEFLP